MPSKSAIAHKGTVASDTVAWLFYRARHCEKELERKKRSLKFEASFVGSNCEWAFTKYNLNSAFPLRGALNPRLVTHFANQPQIPHV